MNDSCDAFRCQNCFKFYLIFFKYSRYCGLETYRGCDSSGIGGSIHIKLFLRYSREGKGNAHNHGKSYTCKMSTSLVATIAPPNLWVTKAIRVRYGRRLLCVVILTVFPRQLALQLRDQLCSIE